MKNRNPFLPLILILGLLSGGGVILSAPPARTGVAGPDVNVSGGGLVVMTYASDNQQERAVRALIKSIRRFGEPHGNCRIFVILGDPGNFPCASLTGPNVILEPVEMDEVFRDYPLAVKAYAAAQVEKRVGDTAGTLVWFDPGTLLLRSLDAYRLDGNCQAALRPVSLHNRIGLTPGEAPNRYWEPIYQANALDYRSVPTMETVVDEVPIQPYYNCEIYSVDPTAGILTEWADQLTVLLEDEEYQETACSSFANRLFLHQAVFSGVISARLDTDDIKPLAITDSYPFTQHPDVPEKKKISSLDQVNAIVFDYAWNRTAAWMERIPVKEPLKSWLFDTYLDYLRMTDNLYRIEGSCNSYLITTGAGSVLIDPAGASAAPEYYRKILEEYPLRAILLTHAHQDHSDDIRQWKAGADIPVIAQRKFVDFFDYQERLSGHFSRRNAIWSGQAIPADPPSPAPSSRNEPTVLFADSYEYVLGGFHFKMVHTPGETPDHTTIWVPELKAVFIGDNYFKYFINNSTFRGTLVRPVLGYIKALDQALAFRPEFFLPGHDTPVVSRKVIQNQVGKFRDALRYIHDETVKGINAGKDPFTLMQEVTVPPEYGIRQGFGKVAWTVRGIYQEYVGWFDGNPVSMYNLPVASVYGDLVRLSGGSRSILDQAEEYFQSGDYIRALHLLDVIRHGAPDYRPQWELRIKTYEMLKKGPYNYIERLFLNHGLRTARQRLNGEEIK